MIHSIRLGALLYCLWLLLSGYYDALLLSLGLLSVVVSVIVSRRMAIIDQETYPVQIRFAVIQYWVWLAWEIVKANLDVTRRILHPKLPISPNVIRVKAGQRTALGLVTYANGITLTPGTVAIDLDGDTIEVHALTEEAALALRGGEMDRRVSAMEGGHA